MVKDANGNEVGKLVKERPESLGQLATELASDADVFTLHVNQSVPVQKKATMLAAIHLIDYMFFENEGEVNLDFVNGQCSFKCCDMYCCGCVCPCACDCGGGACCDETKPPTRYKLQLADGQYAYQGAQITTEWIFAQYEFTNIASIDDGVCPSNGRQIAWALSPSDAGGGPSLQR